MTAPTSGLSRLSESIGMMTVQEVREQAVAEIVEAVILEQGRVDIKALNVLLTSLRDRLLDRPRGRAITQRELWRRQRLAKISAACPRVGDTAKLVHLYPHSTNFRGLIASAVATGEWEFFQRPGEPCKECGRRGGSAWWVKRIA
jgi:hypothetical protein